MGSCPRFIYGNTAQIAYRESHSKFVCTPAAFWRTRSTETVKISTIARHTKSGYPVRHWVAPRKGETRDKAQDYRDECERVEVERRFIPAAYAAQFHKNSAFEPFLWSSAIVTMRISIGAAHQWNLQDFCASSCKSPALEQRHSALKALVFKACGFVQHAL